jgi:hypothetical protein
MRVALACLCLLCACHPDALLPPVEVQAPPVTPAQVPIAESNPPFVETACPREPVTFVRDVRLGTTDGNVLFGFAGDQVVRVSLAGGPPQRLVDRVAGGSDLVVGTQSIFWLADGVVTRAPREGGPATPIALGTRRLAIAGDWLVFLVGDTLTTLLRSGGAPLPLADGVSEFTVDSALIWYADAAPLRVLPLPMSPAPRPDGPAAPMTTDAASVYRALADGSVLRVSRPAGTTDVIFVGTAWTQLIAAPPSVYGTDAHGLWRIASDGSAARLIGPGATGGFALARNSVYFNVGPDVFRVCR